MPSFCYFDCLFMKLKTLKEHLEENPDTTLISLYWSLFWRFALLVYGALFVGAIFITALASLVSSR